MPQIEIKGFDDKSAKTIEKQLEDLGVAPDAISVSG